MGFCLFNNAAIGAAELAAGGERVAIVDWDVHHGNGTQDIFYDDPRVLYVSTHESPLYPGTGRLAETGGSQAPRTNLNLPFPAGTRGDVYRAAFDEVIVPVVESFAPDWLIISAGFDAHRDDPLAGIELTSADYADFARRLAALVPARRVARRARGRLRPRRPHPLGRNDARRAGRCRLPTRTGVHRRGRPPDHRRRPPTLGAELNMPKPTITVPDSDPPTSLEIVDDVVGDGAEASAGNTVSVHYVGVAWSTGSQFDASWDRMEPFRFGLGGGQVIQGWDQGVAGMRVGGRRTLTIPPHLGYGSRGAGGAIAPNETLIFMVDLLDVS